MLYIKLKDLCGYGQNNDKLPSILVQHRVVRFKLGKVLRSGSDLGYNILTWGGVEQSVGTDSICYQGVISALKAVLALE